jgi:hypothetical protein
MYLSSDIETIRGLWSNIPIATLHSILENIHDIEISLTLLATNNPIGNDVPLERAHELVDDVKKEMPIWVLDTYGIQIYSIIMTTISFCMFNCLKIDGLVTVERTTELDDGEFLGYGILIDVNKKMREWINDELNSQGVIDIDI